MIFRQYIYIKYLNNKKLHFIIRNLSDPNNNGKLNQDEFAVAMHLIYRKLNGYDVPTTLPPELVPPSSRELSESVNMIKNMLNSDVQSQSIGLGTYTSGANYAKSRSLVLCLQLTEMTQQDINIRMMI